MTKLTEDEIAALNRFSRAISDAAYDQQRYEAINHPTAVEIIRQLRIIERRIDVLVDEQGQS